MMNHSFPPPHRPSPSAFREDGTCFWDEAGTCVPDPRFCWRWTELNSNCLLLSVSLTSSLWISGSERFRRWVKNSGTFWSECITEADIILNRLCFSRSLDNLEYLSDDESGSIGKHWEKQRQHQLKFHGSSEILSTSPLLNHKDIYTYSIVRGNLKRDLTFGESCRRIPSNSLYASAPHHSSPVKGRNSPATFNSLKLKYCVR